MVKKWVQIRGIVDMQGFSDEEINEDLMIKGKHLKLENIEIHIGDKVNEREIEGWKSAFSDTKYHYLIKKEDDVFKSLCGRFTIKTYSWDPIRFRDPDPPIRFRCKLCQSKLKNRKENE